MMRWGNKVALARSLVDSSEEQRFDSRSPPSPRLQIQKTQTPLICTSKINRFITHIGFLEALPIEAYPTGLSRLPIR